MMLLIWNFYGKDKGMVRVWKLGEILALLKSLAILECHGFNCNIKTKALILKKLGIQQLPLIQDFLLFITSKPCK